MASRLWRVRVLAGAADWCGAADWRGAACQARAWGSSQPAGRPLGKSLLYGETDPQPPASAQDASQPGPRTAGHRTTDATHSDGPGFVKVARGGRAGKAEGARATLTPKSRQSRAEWQQSEAGQERLRERLRDGSLAGWQRRKIEMRLKHGGTGWEPEKKIAVSSMEKIRLLNAEFPEQWTMERLSEQFKVSQESIRRILKSKFRPSAEQVAERERRRREQMDRFKAGSAPE